MIATGKYGSTKDSRVTMKLFALASIGMATLIVIQQKIKMITIAIATSRKT
jgi:hypothetical protein